jgi:putative DNA primase/helicase
MSNDELDRKVIELDTRRARAANDDITPEFTDDALALRFAEEYEGSHRYVAALGKWFLWDGMRWKPDETLAARNNARLICRRAANECNSPRAAKNIASGKTVSAAHRPTVGWRRRLINGMQILGG